MRKFYEQIVKHKKIVFIFFAVATLFCLATSQLVGVNYDMNDYLPEDTMSTKSIDIMKQEFDGDIVNARVMVKNVTIPQALEYKKRIEEVDGIIAVGWLDDSVDLETPLSSMDQSVLENYYVDNNALFQITIGEDSRISACQEIRTIIGDDNAMTGSALSLSLATTSSVKEILLITVIAVVFVLGVLLLTTNYWLEPIVVLIGLGIAMVLNSGTNIIFGEISFVTNAASSVLLLAVSLDYSVFLIHRFEECKKDEPDIQKAMVDAVYKSTTSILSSGLTTVIGFLVLVLMQFRLGADLGLVLGKGVVISLITVFIFMPGFILITYKLMLKTEHKSFMPKFRWLGKFVLKATVPMICIFGVLLVPAYLASNANSYYYGSSHNFGEGTQYSMDTKAIEECFGVNDTYVLMVPKGDTALQKKLTSELKEIKSISSIVSYVETVGAEIPKSYLSSDLLSQLESENYSRMVLSVDVPYEGDETFSLVENIRQIAEKYYPNNNYLAGEGVSTYDLKNTVTSDMQKVNLIAIGAVFLVLILMMRSLIAPIVLVICIETAIWINLSVPYFSGSPVFYIAYLIISSIQLGSTVDYAILMTDRYRENREFLDKKESIKKTISDVTVSIFTSGSALTVVGLLLGFIASNAVLSQLGILIGRGAIFSLTIVMFVLPGFLYVLDRFIVSKKKRFEVNNDEES